MTEIKIKSIDTDNVEKDNSFEKAYAFYVNLDSSPAHQWERCFHESWKNIIFGGRRHATITNNRIRVVYCEGDDLQQHIDFLKKVIEATNSKFKDYTADLELKKKRFEAQKSEEEDNINKAKDELKKLKF